jgi:hypothetical protein
MAEKKTLSKVETYALLAAREKLSRAEAEFGAMIESVAEAHGIDPKKNGRDWQYDQGFTTITFKPVPKEPTPEPDDVKKKAKKA